MGLDRLGCYLDALHGSLLCRDNTVREGKPLTNISPLDLGSLVIRGIEEGWYPTLPGRSRGVRLVACEMVGTRGEASCRQHFKRLVGTWTHPQDAMSTVQHMSSGHVALRVS